jgi:hypothetical protein
VERERLIKVTPEAMEQLLGTLTELAVVALVHLVLMAGRLAVMVVLAFHLL